MFISCIVSLLLISFIQKQPHIDKECFSNDAMVADTIIESFALIEDDTLFNAYHGIKNYPLRVKALSVAPHHTFDFHNERIMAVASYEDTLILITDDERMFHDITFKEDSLRKTSPEYRFCGSDKDDVPYADFLINKGDTICFLLHFDDNLLYLQNALITKGSFPIGPFHIGMTQKEMADSIGIPIEMTNAYKCVALLYGNRFTLLKNMKHPKPWGGPDFSKIIISYTDKIKKIIVVERNISEPVLSNPNLEWY